MSAKELATKQLANLSTNVNKDMPLWEEEKSLLRSRNICRFSGERGKRGFSRKLWSFRFNQTAKFNETESKDEDMSEAHKLIHRQLTDQIADSSVEWRIQTVPDMARRTGGSAVLNSHWKSCLKANTQFEDYWPKVLITDLSMTCYRSSERKSAEHKGMIE